jgi:hypothetical protein
MKEPVVRVGRGKSGVATHQHELDELVAVDDSIASKPMVNSNCGRTPKKFCSLIRNHSHWNIYLIFDYNK